MLNAFEVMDLPTYLQHESKTYVTANSNCKYAHYLQLFNIFI